MAGYYVEGYYDLKYCSKIYLISICLANGVELHINQIVYKEWVDAIYVNSALLAPSTCWVNQLPASLSNDNLKHVFNTAGCKYMK